MSFNTQIVEIDGMHCDACVRRVSQALGSVPGVRISAVELGKAHLVAESASEVRIREALDKVGYSFKEMHAAG